MTEQRTVEQRACFKCGHVHPHTFACPTDPPSNLVAELRDAADGDTLCERAADLIERLTAERAEHIRKRGEASERNIALTAELAARQRFKDFVHRRLDEAGVPVDPPGEHRDAGCRIGQRLDVVFAERDRLAGDLEEALTRASSHWEQVVRLRAALLRHGDLCAELRRYFNSEPPAPLSRTTDLYLLLQECGALAGGGNHVE